LCRIPLYEWHSSFSKPSDKNSPPNNNNNNNNNNFLIISSHFYINLQINSLYIFKLKNKRKEKQTNKQNTGFVWIDFIFRYTLGKRSCKTMELGQD
jgi:hypothetical protein